MFVPKITLTNVPVDASSVLITDVTGDLTTGTIDTTGYDSAGSYPYYPQNNTQWKKFVLAQYLGGSPTEYYFDPITDYSGTASGTVNISLGDGIWLISVYFMVASTTPTYTIDATKKILTRVGGNPFVDAGAVPGVFEGVYAVSLANPSVTSPQDTWSTVASVTSTTMTLNTALDASTTTNSDLNLYYRAQKYMLVMNAGEQSLISDIGDMAIASLAGQGCDRNKSCELAGRMILKLSAQIAFNCGNYAKAHNAAVLFTNSVSSNSSNCSDC